VFAAESWFSTDVFGGASAEFNALLGILFAFCSCLSSGQKQLNLDAPVSLEDGGIAVAFSDGTVAAPAEVDSLECHADAGALYAFTGREAVMAPCHC
jgi:hypothetical protein